MFKEQVKILQNMPIFGGMSEQTLETLLSNSEILSYKPGEFIYKEDDSGNALYVIIKGTITSIKEHKGNHYRMGDFSMGDAIGILEALNPSYRFGTAQAFDDVSVIKISAITMLRVYHEDLEQYTLLQMNMGREIARRLRVLEHQMFYHDLEALNLEPVTV